MPANLIVESIENAPVFEPDSLPSLYEEVSEGEPFPMEALSPLLQRAAMAIYDKVRAPLALGAQSVLAAVTVTVQSQVNVQLPTGEIKPCNNFFLSIAESGERKTACDNLAMGPIKHYEDLLRQDYAQALSAWQNKADAWKHQRDHILKKKGNTKEQKEAALQGLGPEPPKPLTPVMLCEEPTYGALCKLLEAGQPSIGIFTNEGGQFLGGHGMRDENKLQMITGLSKAWDGQEIKRIRVLDGITALYGRRVAMHLMVQPEIASVFLSDRLFLSQGFLSRFLVSFPPSTMGTRHWQDSLPESDMALQQYSDRLVSILKRPMPLKEGTQNELSPITIPLSPKAREAWIAFYNVIESQLGPHGALREISGFANKAPEHAARLACAMVYFEDPGITEVSGAFMAMGIQLVQFYMGAALRLFNTGPIDPTLQLAERLRHWLQSSWKEDFISVTDICQYGPNPVRDRTKAIPLITILEESGHILRWNESVTIKGKSRREAWKIVRTV